MAAPAAGAAPSAPIVPIAAPLSPGGGRAWAYLVVDDPLTLIDGGPNTDAAYAAIRDGLARAGVGIGALRRIVITHAHAGHCGLAGRLHADSGARVAAHPLALAALADVEAAWAARAELAARAAAAGGVPADVAGAFARSAAGRVALVAPVPRDAMEPLANGASVRFAATGAWRAFHAPGHSPDHLVLHDPSSGTAFAGDLLLRSAPTTTALEPRRSDGSRPATLDDLIASWRALGRRSARVVHPGHGAPIRAHRVLLARRLAECRASLAAARDAVRGGASTLWEVARATGLSTEPEALGATLGDVVARLDALAARGLVERRSADGTLRFAVSIRSGERRDGRGAGR